MPGPVRADGLFFACAKSKVKSTHKGSTPYVSPERVPAFGWAEGTRMSQPAPTCFLPRQALSLAPSCAAKPHYTVPDRAGPASLPGRGTPHPGAACGTPLKKGKVLHRCTSPTIVWGRKRVQISLEHERLSGGAGFFKGRRPLNALLVPFRASEKGPAARGRTPRIPVPPAAHFSKKVRCCTAAQKEPQRGGGYPASRCRLRHTSQKR